MSGAHASAGSPSPEDSAGSRPISTGPPRLTALRELQLVEAHRAGDPEAASELLAAYQRRIYGVCLRMLHNAEDARDLAQDCIVRVLEGLGSFDGRSKLSTWVIRVTMNCCLSHLRKAKLRRHQSLEQPPAGVHSGGRGGLPGPRLASGREPSPTRGVEQDQARAVLLAALGRIDPEMRAVLVLRDLQDMEYQQIGTALEIPVGTVKSRLFRARAALRAAVEELSGDQADEEERR